MVALLAKKNIISKHSYKVHHVPKYFGQVQRSQTNANRYSFSRKRLYVCVHFRFPYRASLLFLPGLCLCLPSPIQSMEGIPRLARLSDCRAAFGHRFSQLSGRCPKLRKSLSSYLSVNITCLYQAGNVFNAMKIGVVLVSLCVSSFFFLDIIGNETLQTHRSLIKNQNLIFYLH